MFLVKVPTAFLNDRMHSLRENGKKMIIDFEYNGVLRNKNY